MIPYHCANKLLLLLLLLLLSLLLYTNKKCNLKRIAINVENVNNYDYNQTFKN